MTKNDVQPLMDTLRAAETAGHSDSEVISMLERRGRNCISANYINKAKAAAKNAKSDADFLETCQKQSACSG